MAFAEILILDAVAQHVVGGDEVAVADSHDRSFPGPALLMENPSLPMPGRTASSTRSGASPSVETWAPHRSDTCRPNAAAIVRISGPALSGSTTRISWTGLPAAPANKRSPASAA